MTWSHGSLRGRCGTIAASLAELAAPAAISLSVRVIPHYLHSLNPRHDRKVSRMLKLFRTLAARLHFGKRLCRDRRRDRLRPVNRCLRSPRRQYPFLELLLGDLVGPLLGELLLVSSLPCGFLPHGHNLFPCLAGVLLIRQHVYGASRST